MEWTGKGKKKGTWGDKGRGEHRKQLQLQQDNSNNSLLTKADYTSTSAGSQERLHTKYCACKIQAFTLEMSERTINMFSQNNHKISVCDVCVMSQDPMHQSQPHFQPKAEPAGECRESSPQRREGRQQDKKPPRKLSQRPPTPVQVFPEP